MKIYKKIRSSDTNFKRLEVDVDTVFVRHNEKKWIKDDIHIGWIYDEIWYNKDEYIEEISNQNEMLSDALIEISMMTAEKNEQNEAAIVELATMIGGMM